MLLGGLCLAACAPATNGQLAELGGSTILTGAEIPAPGCWRFTGISQDSRLSFVVYIED